MARSDIIHQAQFLEKMATLAPGSQPCDFKFAAMRLTSSPTCAQVKSFTTPLPMGWVRAMRLGSVFSQWYRRCRASISSGMLLVVKAVFMVVLMVWFPADTATVD